MTLPRTRSLFYFKMNRQPTEILLSVYCRKDFILAFISLWRKSFFQNSKLQDIIFRIVITSAFYSENERNFFSESSTVISSSYNQCAFLQEQCFSRQFIFLVIHFYEDIVEVYIFIRIFFH